MRIFFKSNRMDECDVRMEMRARTWQHGGLVAAFIRDSPPLGYRVVCATQEVTDNADGGHRGGRRCHVLVDLMYVDSRMPVLKLVAAQAYLAPFEAMAQGRDPFPPIEVDGSRPGPRPESASASPTT